MEKNMQRRDFLYKTGALFSAAALTGPLTAGKLLLPPSETASVLHRRPNPDNYDVPILKALAYGMQAPSPHNTQAWKFRLISDYEAMFFVDEKRLLPATDPPARQIHMGCGTFLAVLALGIEQEGYKAAYELLPEGTYGPQEIGRKPVARIQLTKAPKNVSPLSEHIFTRSTSRLPYSSDIVDDRQFAGILNLFEAEISTIRLINQPRKLEETLLLLYKGMEVEAYDYKTYDETRKWFRVGTDIAARRDGINLRSMGESGIQLWFAEMLIRDYKPKDWHNEAAILSFLRTHYNAVMASGGVVTFTTATNNQLDWLRAGIDYGRFQLAASAQGLSIHPLSQVLQEFPAMAGLAAEFNQKMNVQAPAKVQMAVRIGRSPQPFTSYRIPLENALTTNSAKGV
jgi:hypothetical protein